MTHLMYSYVSMTVTAAPEITVPRQSPASNAVLAPIFMANIVTVFQKERGNETSATAWTANNLNHKVFTA